MQHQQRSRGRAAIAVAFVLALVTTGAWFGRELSKITPDGAGNTTSSGLADAAYTPDSGLTSATIATAAPYVAHVWTGITATTSAPGTLHVLADVSNDGTNWYPLQRCSNSDAGIQVCKAWQQDFAVVSTATNHFPVDVDPYSAFVRFRINSTAAEGSVWMRGFKSER